MENKKTEYRKGKVKLTLERKVFNEKYEGYSDIEIQKEILFTQNILVKKIEKIRKYTLILVDFLVVIPIVIGIIYLFFTFGRNGGF